MIDVTTTQAAKQDNDEKLDLEIRKLRWDLSRSARVVAFALPVAAAIVAICQIYLAYADFVARDARDARDLELKEIANGVAMVEFTAKQAEKFRSPDTADRVRALTYVSTMLPEEQACRVINTVLVEGGSASGFSDAAHTVRQQLAVSSKKRGRIADSCNDQDLLNRADKVLRDAAESGLPVAAETPASESARQAVANPVSNPSPARSPTPAPACPSPPAMNPDRLVVYYQIVQQQDRDAAAKIGSAMPPNFPSAGIELVRLRPDQFQSAEVRYYYNDQVAAADYLACLLNQGMKTAGVPATAFKTTPLEGRYKNKLPRNRIEVWFPRMTQS